MQLLTVILKDEKKKTFLVRNIEHISFYPDLGYIDIYSATTSVEGVYLESADAYDYLLYLLAQGDSVIIEDGTVEN